MRGCFSFLFCLSFFSTIVQAQSIVGITNTPDTSFSTKKEFLKLRKSYPWIEIAEKDNIRSVKEKNNVVYCSRGSRNLMLDVFYPTSFSKEKRIAVMFIHGGGWRSGSRTQHHPLAQRLADLGYVVFTSEYRLSTEALYPAAVYDLKAALRWIHAHASEYNIDAKKIAMAGFSAGGQLAALIGTTNNNKKFDDNSCNRNSSSAVNAIIDIDGILSFVHPESGEGDDNKKTSAATYWFGYSKKENPKLWEEASPLNHVNSNTPPTLFINSSVARMHAGRDDFMKVLQKNKIYNDVRTFADAPHSFVLFHPWFEPTLRYIDEFLQNVFEKKNTPSTTIVVAKNGSGQFTTVQAAFNSIPLNNKTPVTVFVKSGTYYEKLQLDSSKNFVTLIGEDKFNTILAYNDHTGKLSAKGDTINTYTSQSFLMAANDFTAQNITFQNDAGFSAGQAVALQITGDRAKFSDCSIVGNQDVLFASRANTRQYFEHCYIEGTTDFIFGPSTAWFQQCHIHSKKNSHITAASTPEQVEFGYVFNDCVLTADSALNKVTLGRPWRPYASVTYIHCYMDRHIIPEGWNNWNGNTANEKTARYAEYKSYGPGANVENRFKWTTQLSDEQVKSYTIKNVFGGWDPSKQN